MLIVGGAGSCKVLNFLTGITARASPLSSSHQTHGPRFLTGSCATKKQPAAPLRGKIYSLPFLRPRRSRPPRWFFRISRSMRRCSFSRRRRAFSAARSAPAGGIAAALEYAGGDPAFPRSPASRQERSIEAAIPSSRAIWLNGRPLLASNSTAYRLNSSVN
jgi:hypothetical protein